MAGIHEFVRRNRGMGLRTAAARNDTAVLLALLHWVERDPRGALRWAWIGSGCELGVQVEVLVLHGTDPQPFIDAVREVSVEGQPRR